MAAKPHPPARDLVALVQQDLPALWAPGAFLVLSMRFPLDRARAPAFLQLLIDVQLGTCVLADLEPTPLGQRVGIWLEAGLRSSQLVAGIYTDNLKTVDRATLVAWAATRRSTAYCHPACTAPATAKAVFDALMRNWANAAWRTASSNCLPAGHAALQAWRAAFNAGRPAAATTALPAMPRDDLSAELSPSYEKTGAPRVPRAQ